MRRLITVVTLIAFNCIVILAQQTDKQLTAKTPVSTEVPASRTPEDGESFHVLPPQFTFGRSRAKVPILPSDSSTKQEGTFVVLNGAVYMTALGGRSLIPMPGGGASGCFNLDLPRRITNLEEFLVKLGAQTK